MNSKYLKKISLSPKNRRTKDVTHWFPLQCAQDSVQFSHSVESHSLWPHGLYHARPPCPGVYSNSCPLSWWCRPTISSSVFPFFFLFQSFAASGSFSMTEFFTSGGQSIGISASASVLPMNIQYWFPLEFTGWICWIQDSQESSPTPQFKSINYLVPSFLYSPTLSHPYMTTGKTIALTRWIFADKVMYLHFNMLSSYSFSSKGQASLNFMVAVTIHSDFGAQEYKVSHCFHCLPIYLPWSDETGCHDLSFLNVEY